MENYQIGLDKIWYVYVLKLYVKSLVIKTWMFEGNNNDIYLLGIPASSLCAY